jgi:hypothetical protein
MQRSNRWDLGYVVESVWFGTCWVGFIWSYSYVPEPVCVVLYEYTVSYFKIYVLESV